MKEKIETTTPRAKEIRPQVERLVTMAKKQYANNGLAALRLLLARLPRQSARKLFYELGPRYKDRPGGYLRIVKKANVRKRDAAPLASIEFV